MKNLPAHSHRALWPAFLAVALLATGCGRGSETEGVQNALFVDPASLDFSANPKVRERILGSVHGYYRFINVPFSREVCRRLGVSVEGTPLFNLHGDAHIEQYAVTDIGRGLTDFDDSSTGPAVVDLLRFGVSLELACREEGCGEQVDRIFDEFLRGYAAALEDPTIEAPEPAAATRLKEGFRYDRQAYFEWIASIMEPMEQEESEEVITALEPYVEAMLLQDPSLGHGFFDVVEIGYLRMGIGSALDLKYLVRVRGATDEGLDDKILEIKQVRELGEIECIAVSQGSDPFRILVGQSRIAYRPYDFLGYMRMNEHAFWVHSWVENYKELGIGEDFASFDELSEVAYDVGVQLGRGHPNQIGAPLDLQLRREQMRLLERDRGVIQSERRALADLVGEAWERFRDAESGSG